MYLPQENIERLTVDGYFSKNIRDYYVGSKNNENVRQNFYVYTLVLPEYSLITDVVWNSASNRFLKPKTSAAYFVKLNQNCSNFLSKISQSNKPVEPLGFGFNKRIHACYKEHYMTTTLSVY